MLFGILTELSKLRGAFVMGMQDLTAMLKEKERSVIYGNIAGQIS